ncbi:MAG: hypothetical protein J5I65_03615 [Aridibacter famidurans]|nr:hypothetical protein [Aridibacter famidurans]
MVRNILAAILGLIVGWVVFTAIQTIGTLVFPPPVALDTNNLDSIKAYMESLSPAMYGVVLAGYAIGSFAAGLLIGKIAESKGNLIPIIVGGLFTIGWILNLIMLPHPIWVAVLGFFMYIPFTILGKNLTAGSGTVAADAGLSSDVAAAEAGIGGDLEEAGSGLSMDASDVSDSEGGSNS